MDNNNIEQRDIVVFEGPVCQPEERPEDNIEKKAKADKTADIYAEYSLARTEKRKSSWDDPVSKKFFVIALAIVIVINLMALSSLRHQIKELADNTNNSEAYVPKQDNESSQVVPFNNYFGGQEQGGGNVSVGAVIYENNGAVYIADVTRESAKKAGLKEGDKIISVDGNSVSTCNDLINQIQAHKAGDIVELIVERSGKKIILKAELE